MGFIANGYLERIARATELMAKREIQKPVVVNVTVDVKELEALVNKAVRQTVQSTLAETDMPVMNKPDIVGNICTALLGITVMAGICFMMWLRRR